ncbi:MAG: hypothetical protein EP341_03050 [Sphingomonadales bacterium]|nr:MAG: hypothetical protein EP341_03050 [Sphingomonadales bacterium]
MAISDWSTTASSNGNSDANINWQEGQAPSTVNDSARSMMTRLKHWWNQLGANTTQGGASNAYTITSGESLSAYANGMRFLWQPNADSTGAVTLNVDAIGAKKVYLPDGTQAGSGDLDADSMYDVVYDTALDTAAGGFKIVGFPDSSVTGGPYLTVANNLSDLASAATAQTNLGYTAADVLSKLLTVDGAGSSLDADTLDGVQGSAFAQLSGSNTFTGAVIFNSSSQPAVQRPTQQAIVFNNAAGTGRYIMGRDLGATDAQDFFLYDSASAATRLTISSSGEMALPSGTLTARVTASSETSGTLTSASANKQITAAGGITIPASVFAAGDMIVIDGGGTARTITRGSGLTMYIAGTDSATGTLTANGLMGVRFRSATVCILTGDVS